MKIFFVFACLMACAVATNLKNNADDLPALFDAPIMIEKVNNMPASTWRAGLNNYFEGWTRSELKRSMGTIPEDKKLPILTHPDDVVQSLPASFDSRKQWPKCIGPIMNQAKCGSCWAFGAAEAISDRMCISGTTSKYIQRAPLDLVSCDYGFFANNGCQGGQLSLAWQYAKQYGVTTESCLPYGTWEGGPIPSCTANEQPCLKFVNTPSCNHTCHDGSSITRHKIGSVYSVQGADQIAAEIMKNGPVEGAFTVYGDFPHYKTGVYTHQSGKQLGGHAIKIIGWGTEDGTDYWMVQNSWTTAWGDGGYFKIRRGQNDCGIEGNIVAGSA